MMILCEYRTMKILCVTDVGECECKCELMFVNVIVNVNVWLYMKCVYMKSVFFCKCQKWTKIGFFVPAE
jgi:hypothetical protein